MALLEISVVPVGTNSASFSSYVNDAVNIIQQKGLSYQITPTATVIEGEINQLMDTAKEIHQKIMANSANRVVTSITIDDRRDKDITINNQINIVEKSLS